MPIFGGTYVGGMPRRGLSRDYIPPGTPASASPLEGLFKTGVEQQAGDYGNIMEGYRKLLSQGPSSEYSQATANLGELARTGGLSDADITNLRARGVSPIRSIYSSAQRNLGRQRALQGGYSPGYGVLQSRLAREMSEQLAGKTTDVEAAIAEMRQKGRLQAAPSYAAAAGRESEIPMEALRGMTSLYGTTPALPALYGGQALSAAQLQNQMNQQRNQYGLNLISRFMS